MSVVLNKPKYLYQVFGLPIESEIELPALIQVKSHSSIDQIVRVVIDSAEIEFSQEPLYDAGWYKFSSKEFYYNMPGVVKFFIRNGEEIIIEPLCDDWLKMLMFFYSNAIAAMLLQKGLTPFHMSGILDDTGKVWLFAAPSRVGKSTLAVLLKERGYELFTDDTALLELIDGKLVAIASYPMVRVWGETLEKQQAFEDSRAYQMRDGVDKFGILFHEAFMQEPVEVAGIVFLNNTTDDLRIEPAQTVDACRLLGQKIYRNNWVSKMGIEAQIYKTISNVLSKIPTFVAYRPQNVPSFDAFAEMINDKILLQVEKENP